MDVLLVEDDPKTALFITQGLEKDDFVVHWAATGMDGLVQSRRGGHRLFIVDRMLPGLDGLSLVKTLRAEGCETPALFLTTMDDLDARIEGLNAGADDYLTKPFALPELLARMNALIRRSDRGRPIAARLRVGSLQVDLVARQATREGKAIDLQMQELKLLEFLMRNAGRIVTRAMLLENVWEITFDPRSNIVESHMSRLRAKLSRGFVTGMIHTVRGEGYVIRPD